MEKAVEELLIGINERVQFCRHGKDQMEIRSVDDLRLAGINPEFFKDGLAAGTVAVAAGIVMHLYIPAFPTGIDIAAEFTGLAVHNGVSGFRLNVRRLEMQTEVMISEVKNLLNFMHGAHLPEHQKG